MPHLLVPDLADALVATKARRLLNLNLEVHKGETRDFSAEDHLALLRRHAPDLRLDAVLADPSVVDDHEALHGAAADLGAELVVAPWSARGAPGSTTPPAGRGAPRRHRLSGDPPPSSVRRTLPGGPEPDGATTCRASRGAGRGPEDLGGGVLDPGRCRMAGCRPWR